MEHSDNIPDRFNEVCFTLSREDILKLDEADNGPINNVISRINRHCFGVKLFGKEMMVKMKSDQCIFVGKFEKLQ